MQKFLLLLFPFAAFAQQPDYYEGIDFNQNGPQGVHHGQLGGDVRLDRNLFICIYTI